MSNITRIKNTKVCRVISQQHGGSGDLRNKDFVIAILHCHKFMHYRCLRK